MQAQSMTRAVASQKGGLWGTQNFAAFVNAVGIERKAVGCKMPNEDRVWLEWLCALCPGRVTPSSLLADMVATLHRKALAGEFSGLPEPLQDLLRCERLRREPPRLA